MAALLKQAEEDLIAFYGFPQDHWTKLSSANPLERVDREIGRRADLVDIFSNDRSLMIRLAASVVIEQNDCVSGSLCAVRLGSEAHPRLAA